VFVSELCLGTMTFGGRGQIWEMMGALDQKSVDGLVGGALDAGINFVDTANVYSNGESETLVVWSRLAGGFLSGKFTRDSGDDAARRAKFDFPPVNKEKGFDILDEAKTIADRHGISVAQIALAWILANSAVTSVIIGARKPSQLEDNLKAIDVKLSADDLKALDEVSKLTPEYPAWMKSLGSDRRPGERRY
jgi:aryl-alcohol dehydrogenase-like predicted oxidoreductase